MRREVGSREEPFPPLNVCGDGRADGPAIEDVRAPTRDLLQRLRQIEVPEDLARFRSAPPGQEDRGRSRILRNPFGALDPLVRDDLRHRETVAGVTNRRCEGARQRDRAVLLEQRGPPGNRTWHGHRARTLVRYPRYALRHQGVGVRVGAGPAARVQAAQGPRLRVVDDREDVTADAGHGGLDHREHGSRGHCGIDRVSACLQGLEPGGGRERLACGNHAVAAEHG